MVDKVEEPVIGPVQILEHQHERPPLGQPLEEPAPRRERLGHARTLLAREADERAEVRGHPLHLVVRHHSRHGGAQLLGGLVRRIRIEQTCLRLDHLAERPVGDAFAVRQAAALPPAGQRRLCVDVYEQLSDEPALADPRLADDRHQLHRTLLRGALERADQERLLELAADERRRVAGGEIGTEPGASGLRPPQRQRLRLPLHGDR